MAAARDEDGFPAKLEQLCNTADVRELIAFYQGLPLYPNQKAYVARAGEGARTKMKAVFEAVDRSTEEGRRQVARIVGRDTSNLSPQEIRAAALETLSENLSDGVIAPRRAVRIAGRVKS